MTATLRTLLLAIPLCCGIAQAVTVKYHAQELGGDMFRLNYSISGTTFARNQEFELQFQPDVYRQLANPAGPVGFDILLFQPDNPLGAAGRFSALALFDNPALTGGFSLDVRVAVNRWPASHKFSINELDERGVILRTITEGDALFGSPEPSTLFLTGAALALACACRRRLKKTG
jgi:hypothetical protein